MSSPKRLAVWLSVAAALVFAAAFMPWGEIRHAEISFGDGGVFGGLSFTVTGWNGSVTLVGLTLPNWLVVLAAGGVALVGWLRASGAGSPAFVPIGVAGYGLLHSLFALVALAGSDRSSAGVGSLLTAAAFAGMLVLLGRHRRDPAPGASAEPAAAADRAPR